MEGRVKLCDFDLVQLEPDLESCADPVGTLPFLAPEVRNGKERSVLSDQFAFAMTIAFVFLEKGALLNRSNHDTAELVGSLACTMSLKRCLERALSPDPVKRYKTLEELMAGLGPEALTVNDRRARHALRML